MVTKVISILFMSALFIGCIQYKIHMPTDSGYKDQLKLDGFYYTSINPKSDAVQKNFLYENGVVLNMMAFDKVDLSDLKNQISDFNKYNTKRKKTICPGEHLSYQIMTFLSQSGIHPQADHFQYSLSEVR